MTKDPSRKVVDSYSAHHKRIEETESVQIMMYIAVRMGSSKLLEYLAPVLRHL